MLSFISSRRNWDSHNPSPAGDIPDPQHWEIRYLAAVDWTGRQARLLAPGFWTRSAGSGRLPPPSRIISQGSLEGKKNYKITVEITYVDSLAYATLFVPGRLIQ